MRARGLGAAGTAALALYVAGGVAAAPQPGPFNCGMANNIAGHKWAIQAVGVSCGTARGVVRELATKTVPRGAIRKVGIFPGTHAGMRCFGASSGQKPKLVTCGTPGATKLIRATRFT